MSITNIITWNEQAVHNRRPLLGQKVITPKFGFSVFENIFCYDLNHEIHIAEV
jgi:hypothetical protein